MRRCLVPMRPPSTMMMMVCAPLFIPTASITTSTPNPPTTSTSPRRPRRHLVVTPYDSTPMNIEPPVYPHRLISTISEEAGVRNNWKELSQEESKRLLEILPSYVDKCKENNIKIRRLHTYADLRRAAGHRARRRLHSMMEQGAPDEKVKAWCNSHLFPAEP